jgi:hypothetical protein
MEVIMMTDSEAPGPLAELGLTSLEEWRLQHLHYKLRPHELWPILLRPCRVRILMVTDAGGSFGTGAFGLKALVDALAVPPGPWVRFEVTTANRRADPTADMQNFSFDTPQLSDFDEIWLFGVERTFSPGLSDQELRALSQFMDDGGGVFATGDHEDLGVAMCGALPRVRSMRKWHWPNAGPNGEPVAPPVGGLDRLDTLREGPSAGFQFDDQSDDVPQNVSPRMYPAWSFPWKFLWTFHPHPVLCGPRGVIRVLPDHPHEGECYVPSDLTGSFTFDGYTIEEYPGLAGGARLAPEVIATSTIVGGRAATDVKGPVTPRSFGAIGAWDGHQVSRGRVLVDATWHHFFNINLVGDAGSPDPLKRLGFLASTGGQAAYEEIKDYFRNIAVWLARPQRHICMRWRALWACRWNHRLVMDLRPQYLDAGLDSLDIRELLRVGDAARDVLGRMASQCQVWIWFLDIFRELLPRPWTYIEPLVDPWTPIPPDPEPDPAPWLHASMLVDAALGGSLYALGQAFPTPDPEATSKVEEVDWAELLRPGAQVAVRRAREAARQSVRAGEDFGRALEDDQDAA